MVSSRLLEAKYCWQEETQVAKSIGNVALPREMQCEDDRVQVASGPSS